MSTSGTGVLAPPEPLASTAMSPDDSPLPPEGTIEWCLGLPLTSHRPFEAEEVTALREESKRLGVNGCLWGCAAPISFLIPLIIVSGIVNSLDKASPLVGVISAALLLIIVPAAFFFLRSRDARRRSRDMRADLRAGYVKFFRGPRAAFQGLALLATLNLEAGEVAAANPEDEVAIEVLPQSRRLWKVDGRNLPKDASLLRRDLSNGYVVVLRLANGARSEPQTLEARPGTTQGTVVELLPLSKWLWTRAGAPAPWRKLAVD